MCIIYSQPNINQTKQLEKKNKYPAQSYISFTVVSQYSVQM